MRPRVLLADDESSVRTTLRRSIEDLGCDVTPVADGQAALDALARGGYQLVVTDLRMPHADGMQVVRAAVEQDPPVPVVVLTGHGTVQRAVEAMRLGAANFLSKPFELPEVEKTVRDILALPEDSVVRRPLRRVETGPVLVGRSPVIQQLRQTVEQIADDPATVLLRGESGTGKEVAARLLHERSSRRGGPFIPVNCAAIPEPLLESELFGHVRGAFTGATQPRTGRFMLASGGTLFLDEIGDMPLALQAKVLRVLEDREVTPVGASQPSRIDVRFVAATNRDLEAMIGAGLFRQDLYFRLSVIPVFLPPLRERTEDIIPLCEHFLQRAAARRGRPPPRLAALLSDDALAYLRGYPFLGNVRELESFIDRVLLLRREGGPLQADELAPLLASGRMVSLRPAQGEIPRSASGRVLTAPPLVPHEPPGSPEPTSAPLSPLPPLDLPPPAVVTPQAPADSVALPPEGLDLREELNSMERRLIREALARSAGNRGVAARMLRINRTTLVEKLKRLRLEEG